jgi:uncharacterized protein
MQTTPEASADPAAEVGADRGPNMLPPATLGLAIAGAAALAAYATLVEPRWIQQTQQRLPVAGLPPAWVGARLALLADLHYGDPWSESLFRRAVRIVNEADVDLIAIAGDFVVNQAVEMTPCARHLLDLRSRRGVLAVLGDHDYRSPALVRESPHLLRAAGVSLLRNESIELEGGLRVCGVEPRTRKVDRADLNGALAGHEMPHLLLTHSPDLLPEAAEREVPLMLCGHTHGGQVVVPFYGPPVTHTRVSRRHASGWSSLGPTRMYTTRGLASHHSLRFLCRPEITFFTLTRAAGPDA